MKTKLTVTALYTMGVVLSACIMPNQQAAQIATNDSNNRPPAEFSQETRKAAEQGDAIAQFNLGGRYYLGKGVPQDYNEAATWLRKAADQGEAKGQLLLGLMYYKGHGVDQDYVQAHRWLNLAALQGDRDAIKNRDLIEKRMSPTQLAQITDQDKSGLVVDGEIFATALDSVASKAVTPASVSPENDIVQKEQVALLLDQAMRYLQQGRTTHNTPPQKAKRLLTNYFTRNDWIQTMIPSSEHYNCMPSDTWSMRGYSKPRSRPMNW